MRRSGQGEAPPEDDVPECPEEMESLVAHAHDLYGRDGYSAMGAINLLSNRELAAWAKLRGIRLGERQVEALMTLNAVMCNPEVPVEAPDAPPKPEERRPEVPGWRKRPEGVEPQFAGLQMPG